MITPEQIRVGEQLEIINFRDARTLARLSVAVANVKAVRLALRQGVSLAPQVGPEVRIGDSLKMTVATNDVLADIHPLRPAANDAGYRVKIYEEGSTVTFKPHNLEPGESNLATQTYTPKGLMELEDSSNRQMFIEAYAHFAGEALEFLQGQLRH